MITPIGATVVLCLELAGLVVLHARLLPFHAHSFNLLRGAIYAAALWLAVGSAVVASQAGGAGGGASGVVQWAVIGLVPLVSLAGVALVHRRRDALLQRAARLRAELAKSAAGAAAAAAGGWASAKSVGQVVGAGRGAGTYEEFYDSSARLGRSFETAAALQTAARTLLYQRDERGDRPGLVSVAVALPDHPSVVRPSDSLSPRVYLSVCACLSVSVCRSLSVCVCLSVPVCLCVRVYVSLSVRLYLFLCLSASLSFCLCQSCH